MYTYTCPECGSHDVTVTRWICVIETYTVSENGDEDIETEEDLSDERSPEDGSIECTMCGYSSSYIDETWYN